MGGPVSGKHCRLWWEGLQACTHLSATLTTEPVSQRSAALLPPDLLREVKKSIYVFFLLSFGQAKCRSTPSLSDYLEAWMVQTDKFFSVKGTPPKQQGKIDFMFFFEQALITWVHWSCCVTLKALVLIFRTLMLLGGAHGRGPKPTTVLMKPWNCKQVKSTESKLCPQSHRVTVFSPQGLWRGRCIIAFQKGKNLGSIPFSACNTYFLCGLNGVEGDREKKK